MRAALRAIARRLNRLAGRVPAWEVTSPTGTVLARGTDLDLVDDIYRHAPAGSHLHQVMASAGHLRRGVMA